ncbi:MAG: transglycosylase domain-containing protein [Solirubrobacterales bacterium]
MTQRARRRQRRRGGIGSKLLIAVGGMLAIVAVAAVAIASWVLGVAGDAPSLSSCKEPRRGGNSVIFAANGVRLGRIASSEAYDPVSIERIPKQLQLATVAIEDERFYEHGGVDPEGILRAALKDLEAGEAVEGGSTITQQLVRNLCIEDPAQTIERKIEEAKLAIEYSERHSRREILGAYLNVATYGTVEGATAVGVGAASRIYFSRSVEKLDLRRSALLAGLPQSPSRYNPIVNPEGAKARRNDVLRQMARLGYITPARARAVAKRGLGLDVSRTYFRHREPFFFDYVENELIEAYGADRVRRGGLRVHTTLAPQLQRVGVEAMATALPNSTDPASALVSIDPRNGWIRAMASTASYEDTRFNLAAQGRRQPGSTFKAFVLTAAIKQGIDPYSTFYQSRPLDLDLPQWGHWEVATADEGYQGTINLKQATVSSDNTVFAQLDLDVGPTDVARTARSMGIETELDGIPAEGIGGLRIGVSPLELTNAYATLAAGGVHRAPVSITAVELPGGRRERPQEQRPRRVLSAPVAWEVTRLLHDNITEGTGTAAYTGCPGQAGKTGTTDEYTDAWFAGYQPNLATAVWVGYPQSNDVSMYSVQGRTVFGGTFPAEIWHSVYSNGEVPCEDFTEPEGRIEWAPYYSAYTRPEPRPDGPGSKGSDEGEGDEPPPGSAAVGGYDPDAYAPGAGQEPAPIPEIPEQEGGVGGGEAAGEPGG